MNKNKSYIAISFIILVFGIYAVPKIVDRIKEKSVSEDTRMNKVADGNLSYLKINNEKRKMPDFTFMNQDSLLITNNDYKGKVYVVEFFFTTCPSICPIMNRNMLKLENEFGERDDFGIASFSIDPEHDRPMILKKYAEDYGITSLNWHLLTTNSRDDVYELSNKGLNIFAEINPEVAGGFEHQGYFALIDKKGYIRCRRDKHGNPIVYYQGTESDQIDLLKEDIEKLLNE
ncbi:MAG: SCO family protein [Flavobacteriaceae bacterium]|nr:SCO family protein [Flavobacteriaceae bacterium]